ncbi:Outer membrane porin protein (plasmid) [Caballeronia sp. SBC1]|nr:Outer membrane porin protein [Caballeronia sp. SBC2]QIN63837.1 Outer membrane porin protein [Caballeronia sp. SBC1]
MRNTLDYRRNKKFSTCIPKRRSGDSETMKYKTALLGALLAINAVPSFAQSNVTLYGIIDTGVEFVTHADASGNSVVRMPGVTGELPSRWGIRGTEDLGGGWSTIFTLESGFNTKAGTLNQGGRLFGRQALVGLTGPYGSLTFGRQYTMTYWAILDADLLGPDIYGGTGSFDQYLPSARSDNTVVYKGTFGGLTAGATYSFGRDSAGTGNSPGQGTCVGAVPGSPQTCREWSAMLRYDWSGFGAAAAYDEQRGGPGASANLFDGTPTFALTNPGDKDIRMQLNGYGAIGKLKIGGGWLGRRVETVSAATPNVRSDQFYLTAAYPVTPAFLVDGGIYRIVNRQDDTRGTIEVLRTTYFLSKSTAVYLQGAYLANSAKAAYTVSQGGGGTTPAAGAGQLGVMAGLRHSF